MTVRPLATLATLAACAGLIAGCGGGGDDDPQPAPPPPAARTETDTPTAPSGPPEPTREARLETVASGLEAPWDLAFLPDGRALLTERAGVVRLLDRGLALRARPLARIERVEAIGESGLLGVAIDPAFGDNGYVYLYRTTGSGNEVARFELEDGVLAEDEVVLEGLEAGAIHDGGRIAFGPDGALYVTTGEAGNSSLSQDPASLNGKILRLRDPAGKPGEPEIVSSGHRNVQGLDWDADGRLFITEFGPDSDDEVNLIRRGANYGWPEAQGTDDGGGQFTPALVEYQDVIAPSGGTIVSEPGSAWTGSFLFGALVGEQIRRVALDGGKVTADEALFEGRLGRVRTVVEGPGGALYALTNNTDGRGSPREGDDRIVRIIPPAG